MKMIWTWTLVCTFLIYIRPFLFPLLSSSLHNSFSISPALAILALCSGAKPDGPGQSLSVRWRGGCVKKPTDGGEGEGGKKRKVAVAVMFTFQLGPYLLTETNRTRAHSAPSFQNDPPTTEFDRKELSSGFVSCGIVYRRVRLAGSMLLGMFIGDITWAYNKAGHWFLKNERRSNCFANFCMYFHHCCTSEQQLQRLPKLTGCCK